MMHLHHIIPKHMGGTDSPENLIECTIEEHAEHHKQLWLEHGHEWDRIAWLSLSGQISVNEANRMAQLAGASKGGSISSALRKEKGNDIGTWNRLTGNVRTIATTDSCKKGGSKVGRMLVETGRFKKVREAGSKIGGKVANAIMRNQKWMCLECGKVGAPNVLGWHTKKLKHFAKVRL